MEILTVPVVRGASHIAKFYYTIFLILITGWRILSPSVLIRDVLQRLDQVALSISCLFLMLMIVLVLLFVSIIVIFSTLII